MKGAKSPPSRSIKQFLSFFKFKKPGAAWRKDFFDTLKRTRRIAARPWIYAYCFRIAAASIAPMGRRGSGTPANEPMGFSNHITSRHAPSL